MSRTARLAPGLAQGDHGRMSSGTGWGFLVFLGLVHLSAAWGHSCSSPSDIFLPGMAVYFIERKGRLAMERYGARGPMKTGERRATGDRW